jgi:hypothetical protein
LVVKRGARGYCSGIDPKDEDPNILIARIHKAFVDNGIEYAIAGSPGYNVYGPHCPSDKSLMQHGIHVNVFTEVTSPAFHKVVESKFLITLSDIIKQYKSTLEWDFLSICILAK